MEAFFRIYLHQQSRMDFNERSCAADDIFNDLLTITVKCTNIDNLYTKYKVALFDQGMYLYDRFMFEMLLIAKTQSTKMALTFGQPSGNRSTPWMVSYLRSLTDLLRVDPNKGGTANQASNNIVKKPRTVYEV